MGSDRVLAIRSLETGQVRELRPSLREFGWSRWAPDGRSFVCEGTDSNSRQGLYRIDVQTGEVAPIAFSPAGSPFLKPQWSPDGKRVYYGRKVLNNEFAIVERDLASGSEREVVRRKALGVPSVSPDGRYIAATSSSSLLLIPIAGGEPRELLGVTAPERFWSYVAWVPDGRGVIVLRRGGGYGPGELSLVLVGDGQPRKLEIDMRNFAGGAFSVHPDGRQIAYLAGEQKYEVWVLENFLPAAKAAAKQ
jgi:Tol biopolymer transport system component